jgi:hypothetical protein
MEPIGSPETSVSDHDNSVTTQKTDEFVETATEALGYANCFLPKSSLCISSSKRSAPGI